MDKMLMALACFLGTTLAASQQSSADPVAHTLTLSQTTPVTDEFIGSLSIDNAELSSDLFVVPVNLLNFDITVNGIQYGLADLQPFFKISTNCVGEITDISALFSDGPKPDLTIAAGDWDQREFISRSLVGGGLRYTAESYCQKLVTQDSGGAFG